jgi:hypothetical protein
MLYGQWLMNLTVLAAATDVTYAAKAAIVAVFMAKRTNDKKSVDEEARR